MAVIGTGGRGTKIIRSSWDNAGIEGDVIALVPQESIVPKKEKVGLNQ